MEPDHDSPEIELEPIPPGNLVQMAALFYSILAVLAVFWRVTWMGEPLFFTGEEAQASGFEPLRNVPLGLAVGAVVIAVSYAFTKLTQWGERLAEVLAEALGPLSIWQTTFLALISGFAEEVFFRGALQPRVGLLVASLIFGLAHFVPRREFYPWTIFSVLAGVLLGLLFEHTGNLLAPIAAHTLINAINLPLLVRQYGKGGEPPPVGSD